jgi:molybdopterin-binding protein
MPIAHVQKRICSFNAAPGRGSIGHFIHVRPIAMPIEAINVRDQFRGTIKEVIEGPVVSEVDVLTPSGLIVTSVITTRSVKELGLEPGRA